MASEVSMQLTKTVTITIENRELIGLLVAALNPKARESTDRTRTLFSALGNLPGYSDVEAVSMANCEVDSHKLPTITVDEFRRWLPQILSETFAEFLGNE